MDELTVAQAHSVLLEAGLLVRHANTYRYQGARSKLADQTTVPSGLSPELVSVIAPVREVLCSIWAQRGGREPQVRGIGLALLAFPDRDHVKVAREVEYWLVAGNGANVPCNDIVARYRRFLESSGPASRNGNGRVRSVSRPSVVAANGWQGAWDEDGRPVR
jgi:hypothetical protein